MNVVFRDNRGTMLEVGQKVAYNWSGQIAIGTIQSIRVVSQQYWNGLRTFPRIRVKQSVPYIDKVSNVTSEKNLLVLKEE